MLLATSTEKTLSVGMVASIRRTSHWGIMASHLRGPRRGAFPRRCGDAERRREALKTSVQPPQQQ